MAKLTAMNLSNNSIYKVIKMEREEILKKLTEIIQTVLNEPTLIIDETMTFNDFENWDSIIQMMVVASVEQEFGIRFKLREVGEIGSIKDYVDLILSKSST